MWALSGPQQGQGLGRAVWGTVQHPEGPTWFTFTNCMTWVLVYHTVPQFSHLQNGGGGSSTSLTELFEGLDSVCCRELGVSLREQS